MDYLIDINNKNLADEITKINTRVVKRLFPDTSEILIQAKHSALFEFDNTTQIWHELNLKGVLFLASLNDGSLGLIILNRSSNKDCFVKITENTKIDFDSGRLFMMIRESALGNLKGIWINDLEDFKLVQKRIALFLSTSLKK